jgi:3-oxoacyl-[acyl-carrier protein] reductase
MTNPPVSQRRHALITGGSRGLGAAIAAALAERGCRVTINYNRDKDSAEQTAGAIRAAGGEAFLAQAEISDPGAAQQLVRSAVDHFGPVDILVNNAGIGRPRNVFENTLDDYDETMAVNVRGAFAVTQEVIESMRDREFGRLIFLSSIAAAVGGLISTAYATSKAALIGMAHHYAVSLREYGITSNAIAPSLIDTDMVAGMKIPPAGELPFGRMGRPDEVGRIVQFLVESPYITGQTIHINGGRYMT